MSKEAKIELDEEEYIGKFKPFMMDVVFEWCKGASFSQICKMTELFEGKGFFHNNCYFAIFINHHVMTNARPLFQEV